MACIWLCIIDWWNDGYWLMPIRTKNQNALVIGMWNAVCDRCDMKFKNVDLREEWNGLMVCQNCYEVRHPQDFLKGVPDDPSVPWTRPETNIVECGPSNVAGFAVAGCAVAGNISNNIPNL